MFDAIISHRWQRPAPAALSLIELNRSPYAHGLSQNESLSLPHFSELSCAMFERPN
jgi:hypothetical protein